MFFRNSQHPILFQLFMSSNNQKQPFDVIIFWENNTYLTNIDFGLGFNLKAQQNFDGGGGEGGKLGNCGLEKYAHFANLFAYINLNIYYFIRFTLKPMAQPNKPQSILKTNDSPIPSLNFCLNFNTIQTQLQTQSVSPTASNSCIQNQIQRLQKQSNKGKKGASWDKIQQLYYFDAILRFVVENPYLTLSWAQWKPEQYYNFIADRMFEVFGEKGRKANQLKTKDQNLKNQYYNKRNKKIDLVDVALSNVVYFVKKMKNLLARGGKTNDKIVELYNRCDQTLISYQILTQQMNQPKPYELELTALIRFIEQSHRSGLQAQSSGTGGEQGKIEGILQEQIGSFSNLIFLKQL